MDDIDRKIIAVLQKNARISMRDLGGIIAMSNTATAERVRRLEENGVIRGYHADIRQSLTGNMVRAFVLLECKHEIRLKPDSLLRYANEHNYVSCIVPLLSSGLDYMLEICCRDMNELNTIQMELNVFGLTTTHLAREV